MKNGKVVTDDNGRTTIVYRDYFKIGLKGNWKGEDTKNKWIITAYEDIQQKERDKIIHSDSFTKGETLPLNSKDDSTTDSIKLQANAHLGSGLATGALSGIETDEEGNVIGFNPSKFALGFLGGVSGSVAVSKGFKVLKEKPELKEALKKELADTLAKGWENASAKYPLLDLIVKPQYIMQNEKGRIAQAGHLLNKLENSHLKQAKEKLKAIDTSTLTKEQQEVLKVFLGEKSQTSIKGKDLKDIHTLEQGSRKKGAKKILIKHYGVEKTGGLSDDEILDISKVIKKGKINADTFSEGEDFIRYGYDLNENGVNYRVVVDEYNNGKKIFDYYSDRNFTDFKGVYSPELPNTQSDSTIDSKLLSKQGIDQAGNVLKNLEKEAIHTQRE